MLYAILLSIQLPPIDFATQNRSLTFKEQEAFQAEFNDKRMPPLAEVLIAERVLAKFRCIGPMRQWRRLFSFGRNPRTLRLDTSLISFLFIEAGHGGKPAGRKITTLLGTAGGIDDSQFNFATGVHSIRTHLATVTFCGPNRKRF